MARASWFSPRLESWLARKSLAGWLASRLAARCRCRWNLHRGSQLVRGAMGLGWAELASLCLAARMLIQIKI